ncbi:hypothetical protein E4P41_06400, partial [Geodermatophilus sp. DF01-2]
MPAVFDRTGTHPRRIAFYSHDTQGLGHTRRNIALAAALVAGHPDTDVLLVTGNPEAAMLPLPPRTDVVTLPAIGKDADGNYAARTLGGPLELVLDVRARVLEAVLGSFAPDLLIVDKVAAGVRGELLPALATLREQDGTRVVLGLHEVLDRPATAIAEWERSATTEVLTDYYDQVWVYGDPAVYDPVEEYRLPAEVAAMVVHTGYLGHGRDEGLRTRTRPAERVRPPARPARAARDARCPAAGAPPRAARGGPGSRSPAERRRLHQGGAFRPLAGRGGGGGRASRAAAGPGAPCAGSRRRSGPVDHRGPARTAAARAAGHARGGAGLPRAGRGAGRPARGPGARRDAAD